MDGPPGASIEVTVRHGGPPPQFLIFLYYNGDTFIFASDELPTLQSRYLLGNQDKLCTGRRSRVFGAERDVSFASLSPFGFKWFGVGRWIALISEI